MQQLIGVPPAVAARDGTHSLPAPLCSAPRGGILKCQCDHAPLKNKLANTVLGTKAKPRTTSVLPTLRPLPARLHCGSPGSQLLLPCPQYPFPASCAFPRVSAEAPLPPGSRSLLLPTRATVRAPPLASLPPPSKCNYFVSFSTPRTTCPRGAAIRGWSVTSTRVPGRTSGNVRGENKDRWGWWGGRKEGGKEEHEWK